MDRKRSWLDAIVYCNPEDQRLWVPKKLGLGWTINFAHPRAMKVVFGVVGIPFGIYLITLAALRWSLLVGSPTTRNWLVASLGLAIGSYGLNRYAWMRGNPVFNGLTFGMLGALIGFGLQFILSAPLAFYLGAQRITWAHHLYFAAAAALAQTFGKVLMLQAAGQAKGISNLRCWIRLGLLAGLGFTITEILALWSRVLFQGIAISTLIGAWERGIASVFHVYSAGLLAMAVGARRWALTAWVGAAHFAMDWLAGANATLLHWPLARLELAFAVIAATVWILFTLCALFFDRPSSRSP